MTGTMVNLPRVIARSDDADFLRELIQDAAQRLMLEPCMDGSRGARASRLKLA